MNAHTDTLGIARSKRRPTEQVDPDFLADVHEGLSASPKRLPSKYFYDRRGSVLFDLICELPEYYPTRTETKIMIDQIDAIRSRVGSKVRLVEYGSGSSTKTRLLLNHLDQLAQYVPVDISGEHLNVVARDLATDFPDIAVHPVVADFTQPVSLPGAETADSTCVYFPGSTIGNFVPDAARALLRGIAEIDSTTDSPVSLLIGIDLQKSVDVLEAAYDDAEGVTARFNLNLLRRINDELGGDFDIDRFKHLALYNADQQRVEMHLRSTTEQVAMLDETEYAFRCDETILTEYSHKYTVPGFASLAGQCGWHLRDAWTDPNDYFAVAYLTTS